MPTYQPNIPLATDQISESQMDIQGNFQVLSPLVNGIISFPAQGSIPLFPLGTIGLYAKALTGVNELFLVKSDGSSFPLTASSVSGNAGWTYLPSGMKMVWNQATILAGNATQIVSFVIIGFPGFTTTALSIQLTRLHNTTSTNFIQVDSYTTTQFVARRSTSTTTSNDDFFWIAIGL